MLQLDPTVQHCSQTNVYASCLRDIRSPPSTNIQQGMYGSLFDSLIDMVLKDTMRSVSESDTRKNEEHTHIQTKT